MDTIQKLDRWEDQRAVKNLMGIYAQCLLLKKEPTMFRDLWAGRDDVCLGFNDGWYSGRAAVEGYYQCLDEANRAVRDELMRLYPEQCQGHTAQELYGIGPQEIRSLNNAIVEVAADGQTAKYFAVCFGLVTRINETGVVSSWVYSYWCADLVRQGDDWRLWHFCQLTETDNPCGTKWAQENAAPAFPPEAGFEAFAALPAPRPNVPAVLWTAYGVGRPFAGTPALPEPYETFAQTFSYGMKGGAAI